MKKDLYKLGVEKFVSLNPDKILKQSREDSEYIFDFETWRTLLFTSGKMKFIWKYIQGVFKWLGKVTDLSDIEISISPIITDKFNFSLYNTKEDLHIFNCSLQTNFFLIHENEWSDKIVEVHSSNTCIEKGVVKNTAIFNYWKEAEGFEQFVNLLLMVIRKPDKFTDLPIQWNVEFKDRKLDISRVRMQINSLKSTKKPEINPFLFANDEEITSLPKDDGPEVYPEKVMKRPRSIMKDDIPLKKTNYSPEDIRVFMNKYYQED
ncbi:hypothetical protein [Spiroplasma endosymbiont of Amphibalanus improvisus]|uniref:hypothetical protein n=1 Tax=Spiroplasma endosymbiont of Amphibalanus improvisus TaxID=3066327 RepID=UPI00313F0873